MEEIKHTSSSGDHDPIDDHPLPTSPQSDASVDQQKNSSPNPNCLSSDREEEEGSNGQTKRKRLRLIDDEEDGISGLDDALLIHILSLLPTTKEAIKTGVLSKRWANLWTYIPNLSFVYRDDGSTETISPFVSFVGRTLILHTSPQAKLSSFSLEWFPSCLPGGDGGVRLDSQDLDHWIRFATTAQVQFLSLLLFDGAFPFEPKQNHVLPHHVFDCSSLTALFVAHFDIVPHGIANWKFLRFMTIGFTKLSDLAFGKVLSGCPILESLVLFDCGGLKRLDVTCSARLRTLKIKNYCNWKGYDGRDEDNCRLEIVAPNIQTLELSGIFKEKCSLVNGSSLVSVNLDIKFSKEDGDSDEEDDPALELYYHRSKAVIKDLIDGIRHVKDLALGPWSYLGFTVLFLDDPSQLPLSMCKSLTVNTLQTWNLEGIFECMLRISPHLETLTIQYVPHPTTMVYEESFDLDSLAKLEYDGKKPWSLRAKISKCLKLHLKTVKIIGCLKCDKCGIKALAEFFLQNAMVLEKLVIVDVKPSRENCVYSTRKCYPPRQCKGELAEKLLRLPRSSPHAIVTFS